MRNCNNPTLRFNISNDNGNNCCRCGSEPNPPVLARIMLVPGDINGAVDELTRQTAVNLLAAMNFDSNSMQIVDSILFQPNQTIGTLWTVGNGWPLAIKVVPGGSFQPNVFVVTNPQGGVIRDIILVPSDNNGVISNNTILSVGNMLAGAGVISADIQNVNSLLASVGPLSPVSMGIGHTDTWFIKVPGSLQPEMLAAPPILNQNLGPGHIFIVIPIA